MGLENLNDQLYSRDQADERVKVENPYEPDLESNLATQEKSHTVSDGQNWQPVQHIPTLREKVSSWFQIHRKQVLIAAVLTVVLGGGGGVSWYWYNQFFSERNTVIRITTEEQVKSGESVTPTVTIHNENRTSLENVKVIIELPDGFVADVPLNGWSIQGRRAEKALGALARDQETEVALPGKLFGNKGAVAVFKALAEYTPAKISGVYETSAESKTVILSSPITIQVTGPREMVTGQDLDYEIVYKNEGNETLNNVRVKAFLPEGFSFKSATPGTDAFDMWFLNTFRPGDSGKIVIHGSLQGVWNEQKEARFALGYEAGDGEFVMYNDGLVSTTIIASPLSIKQSVNENKNEAVIPGQILSYNIQYQNNSNQGYRDTIVSVSFENPEFLDWGNLDLPQGAYNEADKTITWKASEVPELRALAPGATGNLNFSIPIISDFSSAGVVKNKAVISRATIDSPDIQTSLSQNKLIGSSTASTPLGTLVGFQISSYHNDSYIETDGPLPPEAGEKTEYVLRFRVTNPANDVTQGKVVVSLPGYMRFTQKKYPEDSNVSYNDRANEVTWTVGTMNPGASKEVRVQTEFSPGENLIGKDFTMIQDARFTGMDNFTKQAISLPFEKRNNTLSDDKGDLPAGYNKVVK